MTCTDVRRMHSNVNMPARPRNGRIFRGALLAVLLVCVAVVVSLFLHNANVEQQIEIQQEYRDDMIAELERNEGTYDAQSIVLYNTSRAKAEELAEKLGASLRMTKDGSFATLTLPEGTTILDVCRADENIAYVEQMSADYQVSISELIEGEEDEEGYDERLPVRPTYEVSDSDYDKQTYLDYMNMQNVWASYTGYGVTIAVIDTGIDTDHPEFAGRISEYSYNATEDKIVKDYVLENGEYDWSLVEDEQGHGTAVTGVIAASMNSGNVVGIAPNVTIITIKAECDEAGNFARTSDLLFGLYYAIERDVSVVNMSFGGGDAVFGAATRLAYDSDVICVAAAGNDSTAGLTYPAADPLVIGVGALADGSWELAEYSNYGENVNVVAPGTTYTSLMGGGYGYMDGTSLACPAVTGLIALYMQTHKYVMFDQVTEELYASCYDLGDLGCDWYFGFGAVDANAFLIEERGTVTFDMLTDEVDDIEGTFIRGHALQELPEPDRLYAIFDGWYYDEQCTQRVEYYADAFYGDITLYASWVNEDDGIPFTYRILDDGTIEILSYIGHRRFITVPEKIEGRVVSSIGDFAFQGETNLREVGLPSGLRHIGKYAFAGCSNLVSMYIPENVTEIEVSAFAECVRLSTIAFTGQSKLLTIGGWAFEACSKLRTIELPASLQSINGTAFVGTSSLTAIRVQSGSQYFKSEDGVLFDISGETLVAYPAAHGTTYEIPSCVVTVGDYAFYGAKVIFLNLGSIQTIGETAFSKSAVLTVNIPDSVTKMGDDAFNTSAVRELTIGTGLTEIAAGAFAQCGSLRSVYIPEGIITIQRGAFYSTGLQSVTFAENSQLYGIAESAFACCHLTEIEIPASVEYIGSADGIIHDPEYYSPNNVIGAFDRNSELTKVIFAENSQIKTIGNRAFAFCPIGGIDLPEGLERLGAGAFWTTSLETVVLPTSLIELCEAALGYSCLLDITVSEGNAVYHSVDGVVYNLDNTEVYAYPAGRGGEYTVIETTRSIKPYSFAGSWYLEKVTLPEGLTEVGTYGFCYSGALTYDMPSTLVYIRKGAFYGNYSLSQLSLPDSLEQIAEYAFYGCILLPTVHIPDNVVQIGRYSFSQCWSLASVTFNETAKLPRISYGAFAYCGLKTFRVPTNVSTIAQGAFKGCYKLTSFTFAENSKLESISAYMFDGCSNLQTITFEQGSALTSVQAHGLEGMNKLTTINWGDAKVTNIDNFAFRFCESLADPALPDTVTNVGRYAFYGCKSLSEMTLPAQVEHIGMFAFLGTKDLNLYLTADTMPAYLDEDWDHGIRGYYVGVTNVVTDGDYKYATLTSGDVSIIEYLGSDTEIDLSVLDFGAPITAIGGSAYEDKGITRVTLPDTLTSIQAEAFAYNPLEEITIPASVTFIGRDAFTYTEIASLTFAEGSQIKTIEQYAFERTRNLTEVTLPASLTTMGRGVFQQSGLTSVTFEEGIALTKIPKNAFTETKLTSIVLPDSVNYIDHNAFMEIPTLRSVTFGNAESISLQSNSFYYTGLTSLHIPANVTYIGEYSFVALSNLTEITVDENNPWYKSEDGLLLSKDGRKLIVVPAGRTGSLTVPASVEMLGFGAFEETKLSEVKFDPNANILTLGYRAFFKANNITSIDIPKSVISIDYYAFAYCENLQTVNFAEDNQLKGIYEGAFLGDINLENITIPDTIVEISDFAFYGCSKIDRVPISENGIVKGIYSYAFAYTGISGEFTTPETLIDIGDYAFMGTKITKLTVPDTNQWDLIIGIGAFEDCYKLEEVALPFIGASLDDMSRSWFGYIFGAGAYHANAAYIPESLKTVTIAEGQTLVGRGGFAYLTSAETLNLPHSICALYNDAFKDTTTPYTLTNTIMTYYGGTPAVAQGHFGPGLMGHIELAEAGVMNNNVWTDGIERIGDSAFSGCTGLTSIAIPDSVLYIDRYAFYGCTGLTSIDIPDGVTQISYFSFAFCKGLTSFDIPNSVTRIEASAFNGCTGLTSIILPDSVITLDNGAFANCTGLTSITLSKKLTSINYEVFQNCSSLISVIIPDAVTLIEREAFSGCTSLAEITIPDNVTEIGMGAFYKCSGLKNVTIGQGITSISNGGREYYHVSSGVFEGCTGLTSITIPENVTSIGSDAFAGCTGLTNIVLSDGVTSIGDYAFRGCTGLVDVTIPNSVTNIGRSAFAYCESLTSVVLSNNLTSIGDEWFYDCYALNNIIIPESINSIGVHAFMNCRSLTNITIPDSVTSIGDNAFRCCTSLTSITIPNNVTSIGNGVFDECTSLTSVTIPDGTTSIGDWMFYGCSSLTSITIPDSVTSIGTYAFRFCTSLTSITIPDSVTSIGMEAFAYTSMRKVAIPNSVTDLGANAFLGVYLVENYSHLELAPGGIECPDAKIVLDGEGNVTTVYGNACLDEQGFVYGTSADGEYILYAYLGDAESITLPENICENSYRVQEFYADVAHLNVTAGAVIDGTLYNCINLTSVTLLDGVIHIPDGAFSGCNNLTSITIPDGVTSIGGSAFSGCSSLTSITIPDGVTEIGNSAFSSCTSLTSITISDSVTRIGNYAFDGCASLNTINISDFSAWCRISWGMHARSALRYDLYVDGDLLTSFTVPDGEVSMSALTGCTSLTSITVPDHVQWLDLSDCSGLTSIDLPDDKMWSLNLSGCTGLTNIDLPNSVATLNLSGCTGLTSIELPSTITSSLNLSGCTGLTSVDLPDGTYSFALAGCTSLTSIFIPESIQYLYSDAFRGCTALSEVSFAPNSSARIADYAFDHCNNLLSVVVPGNVTVAAHAFPDTTEVRYVGDNCIILDGILYNYPITRIITVLDKNIVTVNIPHTVTSIGSGTFKDCIQLTQITIPNSVTSIGSEAFSGCVNLSYITIPNSVTSIGSGAFSGCVNLSYITIPTNVTAIEGDTFSGCVSLSKITIPDTVTRIGTSAFADCESLKSVVIPNGVTVIGYSAFAQCSSLSSVTIPQSVTSIEGNAFFNCTSLTSIIIPDGVVTIDSYTFYGCSSLKNVTLGNRVQSIGDEAFFYCSSLEEIIIPDSVTSIGRYAFAYCSTLTEIIVPDGVTSLVATFYQCSNLSNIKLPDNLEKLDYHTFSGCNRLVTLVLPESLQSIGNWVFSDCPGLVGITIPSSVTYISNMSGLEAIYYVNNQSTCWEGSGKYGGCVLDEDGFLYGISEDHQYTLYAYVGDEDCVILPAQIEGNPYRIYHFKSTATQVIIPEGVQCIDDEAFYDSTAIRLINIPDSVTHIGEKAFYNCMAISSMNIPDSVTRIGKQAFYNTAIYNDEEYWLGGCFIVDGWLIEITESARYIDSVVLRGLADSVYYPGCQLLKNVIWNGVINGATNVETLVIRDMTSFNGPNDRWDSKTRVPITVKNIVITKDVDFTALHQKSNYFSYISGVTIFVEANEKDVRWDDNFPGWNNGNRVIYGDKWHWVTFYDEQGNVISQEPCLNEKIVRQPVNKDKEDIINTYVHTGWDINGDEIVDNVPATMTTDLYARPIYSIAHKEYSIVFKDSQTGEIYKQVTLHFGDLITLPETPTREDGYLIGWLGYTEGMTVIGHAEFLTLWHEHQYSAVVIAPTCTEKGYTTYYCHCGDTYLDRYVDSLGHDMVEWYQTAAPTCTAEGENRRDCGRDCGYYETEVVLANGHSHADAVEKNHLNPTCTEIGGYDMVVYCAVCGVELSREHHDIDALGHNMSSWYQIVTPTCTTEGENRRDCGRGCGYYETEVVPANGHTSADAVEENRFTPTCTEIGGYDMVVYCAVCGVELSRDHYDIAVLDHDMGEWYQTVAPTCTTEGENRRDCGRGCGYYETEVVSANGHTEADAVEENRFAPTCTEIGGYDMVVYCTVCGVELSRNHHDIDAFGHDMGEWYQTVAPTCTTEGENKHDCARCDYFETEVVSANGHTEADAVEENRFAPTCTEIGGYDMAVYCSVCGDELSREHYDIEALGHDMGEWYQTIAPTCTTEGENRRDCDRDCGYYETEVVPANGHTLADAVEENYVDSTCTEIGGYDMVVYCSVCGDELSRDHYDTEALGHDMGELYQTITPTCTTEGENRRDCSRGCGYYETEVVPANGHTPADAVEENYAVSTCTDIGGYDMVVYCSACGDELSREHYNIEALGHAPATEWTEDLSPTCTEVGSKSHHCARCDEKLDITEIPANGHSHTGAVTVPTCTVNGYTSYYCHCGDNYFGDWVDALGHTEVIDETVAPTCTATGLTEGKHCSVCNAVLVAQEVVPANGHTYESVVTDPTCTEKGYTTHTCHCGDTYVDSEVDALGHTPSDWIVDDEAQIGVEGSKHKECTVCGETLETEVIEALTEAPTTEPEPSGGCNGTISASVALLALLSCFAVAWRPRKDN